MHECHVSTCHAILINLISNIKCLEKSFFTVTLPTYKYCWVNFCIWKENLMVWILPFVLTFVLTFYMSIGEKTQFWILENLCFYYKFLFSEILTLTDPLLPRLIIVRPVRTLKGFWKSHAKMFLLSVFSFKRTSWASGPVKLMALRHLDSGTE